MPDAPSDDRYLLIDGRRWRRTDPAIPQNLRAELVDELMQARRAVGAALRANDPEAEAAARARVHSAKVALGERGEPWWVEPSVAGRTTRVRAVVDALLAHRPDGSICPSEVARVIAGDGWRSAMSVVREVAFADAQVKKLEIRQRGGELDPSSLPHVRGPIRIARPRRVAET